MYVLRSLVSESWAGRLAPQSDSDASASPHDIFELDRHADEHSHSQSATGHRDQSDQRDESRDSDERGGDGLAFLMTAEEAQ